MLIYIFIAIDKKYLRIGQVILDQQIKRWIIYGQVIREVQSRFLLLIRPLAIMRIKIKMRKSF